MKARIIGTWFVMALGASTMAASAQEMSVEQIRANIQAQIRANENAPAANPNGSSRSIKINNHQDTDQLLYPVPPVAPAAPGGYVAPTAPTTATQPGGVTFGPKLNFKFAFAYNSNRLEPSATPTLLNLAQVLGGADNEGHVFMIIGHTDSIGNDAYNRALSERRAAAVVAELVKFGVPANRLSPLGLGKTEPLENLPATDPHNRRVEVRFFR